MGDVVNPDGLEAGGCWPAFYFGLSPAVTSQFDGGRHFDPETYTKIGYRPEKSRVDPIWTILSKAGKTCAVIDAPYSCPTDEINGMKVVDRSGHVPAGSGNYLNFCALPPELANEINAKFGEDPAGGPRHLSGHGFESKTIVPKKG
ncbi:MAG TPA: hypothetical protein EYQ81_00025 [Sneathiellales bacterium]|nr:hypothetical protein [Sneathiellales bacterium]